MDHWSNGPLEKPPKESAMKRILTVIGAAIITVVIAGGASAASQAQNPQDPQRGGRPEFGCGPERGADNKGPDIQPGRGGQRPPVGAVRGRGPGGGRQGGIGRPGGPGGPGRGGRGNPLCALDLTEEQETQIAAIHQKAQEDVENILTAEQKEKLRSL